MSAGDRQSRAHGTTVAGIQARMGSSRLPGKSLADVAGVPLLQHVVERVRAARSVQQCFVLTSLDTADDELVDFCDDHDIPVRRGPLEDVLARYLNLIAETEARYVVRVTGDSPLVDPHFIDLQVRALEHHDGDWVLPQGLSSSELNGVLGGQGVISARSLLDATQSRDPRDREHVGSFHFAREIERFRVVGLEVDARYRRPGLRLCVDEAADLELVQHIFEHFSPEHGSLAPLWEVLDFLDSQPELSSLNAIVSESADNQEHRRRIAAGTPRLVGIWP